MLPLIDDLRSRSKVVKVPPPTYFRAARNVTKAWFTDRKNFIGDKADSRAKYAGRKYEQRFFAWLEREVPKALVHRWICFLEDVGMRWCQPDFIIPKPQQGYVIIGEVKYQHMPEAYWQLVHLYSPVLRLLYPGLEQKLVEVVRSHDPSVPFPTSVEVLRSLEDAAALQEHQIGVLKWKP